MNLQFVNTINCGQGIIRAVRFHSDGTHCFTCGADKKVKLWNPYKCLLLSQYEGHNDEVLDVASSYEYSQIITASKDKSIIVWDMSTGQALQRLQGHTDSVTCISFNDMSALAISGSRDKKVCCWDVRSNTNNPVKIISESEDCITSAKVNECEIVTGSLDCHLRRYDLRNDRLVRDFIKHPITCLSFTNSYDTLLITCKDNCIRLLQLSTGQLVGEYDFDDAHEFQDNILESSMNFNSNYVISGSSTGEIYYWDYYTGYIYFKLIHTPGNVIQSISANPINHSLLTACNSTVKLWGVNFD